MPLLCLPIGGAALGTRAIAPVPIPCADLALLLFVPWAAWRLRRDGLWAPPQWTRAMFALIVTALLSGLVPWLAGGTPFEPIEFLKSFSKLSLYGLATLLLWQVARAAGRQPTTSVVAGAFAAAGAIGIAIYIALLLGAPVSHSIACGEHPDTCSALYYERRWFGDATPAGLERDVFLRAQGLAAEPTRFGALQAMALGFLLLSSAATATGFVRVGLVLLSALLSFALAPYGLLVILLGLWATRPRGRPGSQPAVTRSRHLGRGLLALAIALGLLLLPGPYTTLRHAIVGRVQRIVSGEHDTSTELRLFSSWTLARRLARLRPITGVGLGNFDVGVAALRDQVPEQPHLTERVQGWNALAYFWGTTGLLGLLACMALVGTALGRQPRLLAFFVAGMFADGSVLSAPFWVFLALYALPPESADTT